MRNALWIPVALAIALIAATARASENCPADTAQVVHSMGSQLCISMDDDELKTQRAQLLQWITRSADIVAQYYGKFPAPIVQIKLRGMEGGGIGGGRTNNEPLRISVRVGRSISDEALSEDWVLVHEMVHLALPEVGDAHIWLAEGLATYVEGIARAQAGNRSIADVWAEDRHSMPAGLPRSGEGGMDQTSSWGRTYWGGALFCLKADIAIRQQTRNRVGLQTALQAILRETGGYDHERPVDAVLRSGDAATGTHVLEELYQKMRVTPMMTDLDALWKELGVPADPKSEAFDNGAPLAPIRAAITARPAT
jgi:hypothetical protein